MTWEELTVPEIIRIYKQDRPRVKITATNLADYMVRFMAEKELPRSLQGYRSQRMVRRLSDHLKRCVRDKELVILKVTRPQIYNLPD